jgi:hypothetical protein
MRENLPLVNRETRRVAMTGSQLATTKVETNQQPVRPFDVRCLVACLAISTFLVVWITLASESFSLYSAVFLFVLPWVLLRAGGVITTALQLPSFFALDFLLGVTVVSTGVLAWKTFVPLSLWIALTGLLIAAAVIPMLLPPNQRARVSGLDLLCIIVSLAGATGWSQDLILPTSPVEGGILFKPWSDFFWHASIVARSLGNETLLHIGNYDWKGFPAVFYHYASYSLPVCLAKVGHLPAYDTVVGFWAPFGSFLAALASYALGRVLWSEGAGLAALVGSFLIPDTALFHVGHPLYGYFWLQHVAPAGLYGVAIAGTALILMLQGAREGRRVWIVSGAVIGALVAFFKVHVFAAAFPLLLSFAILAWPLRNRWRWLILGGCVTAGLALIPLANHFYIGPSIHFDFSGSAWYWNRLARTATGTPIESWYQVLGAPDPLASHWPQAIGLILLSTLGIFAVIAPLVWVLSASTKTWQTSEGISMAAVVILLLMTFGISGDPNSSELIHKPFVWAYWLVGSLTAGRLFSMVAEGRRQLATGVVAISSVVLILVPMQYGSGIQRGNWLGANFYSGLRVDRGLVDCARYIRGEFPISSVAQDSRLDNYYLILEGLSERPAFAARPEWWKWMSTAFRGSRYQEQLRKLKDLQQATSVPDLQRAVRETGIRWYLVHPGDSNVWPAEFRDRPSFESNGYKVYDMQRCFGLRG